MAKTMVGAGEPPDEPTGRLRDPYAERAVLAAVLLGDPLTRHLVSVLEEGDFTDAVYQEIFAAAVVITARGRRIAPVAVITEVERRGSSLPAGLVHQLVTAAPAGATAVHYAAIIRDLTALRRKDTTVSTRDFPDVPMRGFLIDDDL